MYCMGAPIKVVCDDEGVVFSLEFVKRDAVVGLYCSPLDPIMNKERLKMEDAQLWGGGIIGCPWRNTNSWSTLCSFKKLPLISPKLKEDVSSTCIIFLISFMWLILSLGNSVLFPFLVQGRTSSLTLFERDCAIGYTSSPCLVIPLSALCHQVRLMFTDCS